MDGTYRTGDLILTRTHDTYEKGDIVAFKVNDQGGQVIHRIIGGDGVTGYTTQGDNNPDPDPWHPTDADVIGAEWHRFADKAWVLHLPRQPWFAGLTAGLLTLLVLGWDSRPRRRATPVVEAPAQPDETVPASPGVTIPAQRTDSTPAPATSRPRVRRSRKVQPEETPADSTPQVDP
jgi:signal peptidase